ncbi:LexA family protein [Tautonia rosea]|uniref:LexA family protein n=1 Tax=Tautonia rosea TaxID=2728037 RepID=UPI001473B287|nr:S24 family peptidase [Tautonia rosea]
MPQPLQLEFFSPYSAGPVPRPLVAFPVSAGFPSPADDHLEGRIDLNEYVLTHPAATFYVRVRGDSMCGAGIHDGDLLIVDRAAEYVNNSIVIARIGDEFTVKRIRVKGKRIFLMPENEAYAPIELNGEADCEIWGRVVGSLRKF